MFKNIFLLRLMVLVLCCTVIVFQSCEHDDSDTYKMDNQEFINHINISISFKITAGNLAAAATQNTTVRSYAERMLARQNEMRKTISALPGSYGSQEVALPDTEKKQLESLKLLKDDAFDKEFSRLMVLIHQNDVGLFVRASVAGGVKDGNLRSFVERELPGVRNQLAEAQNL